MNITGKNFIGFKTSAKGEKSFQAFASVNNQNLEGNFHIATQDEFEEILSLAQQAFPEYRDLPASRRAEFLDAIAHEIMELGDALIERCSLESSLPQPRIIGERARTCGQLQLFAKLLRDGWWVDARLDLSMPERKPLPKSDIRRMLVPIGPVAVFGASNFPLAFSTAGGDTASALAAGCPVVVKAHSSHPGTNELVSIAIIKAAQATNMPEGVFSSVYLSHDHSVKLVEHPAIKAVGFTGSRGVGMRLFNAAVSRPDPIPVYAEMSAINPVIIMENAVIEKSEQIAKGLAGSVTLGAGQFCTCPGLVLMVDSDNTKQFKKLFAEEMTNASPASMLNKNIHKAYYEGLKAFQSSPEVETLAMSSKQPDENKFESHPVVHEIKASDFISDKKFSEEIFGPATLLVTCKDESELHQALQSLEGQLTATIHATSSDVEALKPVVSIVTEKAGRVIYGEYPTGVEVCHSMQHGGPFPATTDGRATSVGTAAIYRFVRPVAYQSFPDELLPDALKDGNPLNLLRLVDGNWTTDPVKR